MNRPILRPNKFIEVYKDSVLPEIDRDDSFSLYTAKKGDSILLGTPDENNVLFILKGGILVSLSLTEDRELQPNYMYNIAKNQAPYKGIVLEDITYILLKSDRLVPFLDQATFRKLLSYKDLKIKELEDLPINKMLRFYLASIVFFTRNNISSCHIYDLKKEEFLFIMKEFYSKEELAHFFFASNTNQNQFRAQVFSKYTHSMTVMELAKQCFMTTKTFSRHFKTEFGTTPHKWLIQQKITSLNNSVIYKGVDINNILQEFNFSSVSELNKFCERYNLKSVLSITKHLKS